jgi:Spy/CpxP family protein refolding chaperone
VTTRKFIAYAKWALPAACVWTFLLLQSTSSVLAGAPGQNQGRSQGSGASQSTTPRPPTQGRSGGPEQRSNARPEWAWWNDADIKKEIGLGEPMSKRIDDMYQKRQKALAPLVEQFIAQRDEVDRLVKEGQISVDLLTAKVIAVEALRSRLAESRTIMLYNFYKMLTPEQYSKLKNARDKHFDDLRNGRGGSPR